MKETTGTARMTRTAGERRTSAHRLAQVRAAVSAPSRVPASSPARTRTRESRAVCQKLGTPRQLDQRSQDRGRAGKDEGLAHSQGGQLPHHQPEGQGKEGPQQTVRADSTGCHRGCCRR